MPDVVRHAAAEDVPELIELANRVFRSDRLGDMGGEFPALLSPANAGKLCIVERDGRIVSLVGVHRFVMCIEGVDVPVASIGAVCTDPACRGQGLASAALELAMRDARDRGDVLMPISGGRSLYRRNHALPFGPAHLLVVPRERLGEAAGRPLADGDAPAVVALHEKAPVRYRWNSGMFEQLLSAKLRFGGTAWVRADAGGGIDGWALLFVGGTLYAPKPGEAILVDSAGPPERVAALCAAAMDAHRLTRLRVRLPWHAEALVGLLAPLADENRLVCPASPTMKIVSLSRLISLFADRLAPLSPAATDTTLRLTLGGPSGRRSRSGCFGGGGSPAEAGFGRAGGRRVQLFDPAAIHHLLLTQPSHWPAEVNLPRDLGAGAAPGKGPQSQRIGIGDRGLQTRRIAFGASTKPGPIPIPDYGLCYV